MAYDIGPRIGIDGEAELRKQLNNLNTTFKTLGTELKKVSSEFADNAQSQQALISKNKVLSNSVTVQKQKLTECNKALEEAKQKYGENSNEALRWQQVVNNTETTLNKLEREIRQNDTALDEMKQGLRDAETGMRKAGDEASNSAGKMNKLEKATSKVKEKADKVSGATAPLTAGIGALGAAAIASVPATEELRTDLSKLDINAREAGVGIGKTRDAYKAFNVVSDETDSSVEATSNLLQAGFTKSNLQTAVEGLSGAYLRFPDTLKIEGLSDGLQETLATGKPMGMFGEMLDRVGVGADNFANKLKNCKTDAEKQNLVLQTLADAGLNDTYNGWKKNNKELVKSKEANANFQETLAEFATSIQPILTTVMESVTGLIDTFNGLPNEVKIIIGVMLGMVAAISPVASVVGNLSTVFGALGKGAAGFSKIGSLFSGVGTVIKTVLSGIGGALKGLFAIAMANPIVAIITIVVGAIILLWNKCEWFRNGVKAVFEFLKAAVLAHIVIFKAGLEKVKAGLTAIKNFFSNIGTNIKNFATSLMTKIWSTITSKLNSIKSFWSKIWNGVCSVISSAKSKMVSAISNAMAGIKSKIFGIIGQAKTWGRHMIQGIIDGIFGMIGRVKSAAANVANSIRSFLHFTRPDEGPLRDYEQWMPHFMGGMAKGLKSNQWRILDPVKDLSGKMADAMNLNSQVAMSVAGGSTSQTFVLQSDIYLGGKKIADSVTSEVEKNISRKQANVKKSKGR